MGTAHSRKGGNMREVVFVLGIVCLGLLGSFLVIIYKPQVTNSETPATGTLETVEQPTQERYVEMKNPSGFLNAEPFAFADLVGEKVILVNFLTYSCINCQRTFPYLNEWYTKYGEEGLAVIGIHTPEFAFEKDIENVRMALATYGIEFPVVLDNDYATWRAYGNNYWPRKYLIDIEGNIVYDHIGEGAYEETEEKIREALREREKKIGATAL